MAYIRAKDRIGTTINGFYIKDVKREDKRTYALAICPYCKKEKWIRLESITGAKVVSCGCYNFEHNQKKAVDITGNISGRLKAVKPTEERDKNNGSVIWECNCECGGKTYVSSTVFVAKKVKSCGCLDAENRIKNGTKAAKYVKDNFCMDRTNICAIKNKKMLRNNTSGIRGVCWDRSRKKWIAQIEFKGKNYFLGRYNKKEDAAEIRKIAEKELFGNFLDWYAKEYPEQWKRLNKKKSKKDCN